MSPYGSLLRPQSNSTHFHLQLLNPLIPSAYKPLFSQALCFVIYTNPWGVPTPTVSLSIGAGFQPVLQQARFPKMPPSRAPSFQQLAHSLARATRNCFCVSSFRTLAPKHPGWVSPRQGGTPMRKRDMLPRTQRREIKWE